MDYHVIRIEIKQQQHGQSEGGRPKHDPACFVLFGRQRRRQAIKRLTLTLPCHVCLHKKREVRTKKTRKASFAPVCANSAKAAKISISATNEVGNGSVQAPKQMVPYFHIVYCTASHKKKGTVAGKGGRGREGAGQALTHLVRRAPKPGVVLRIVSSPTSTATACHHVAFRTTTTTGSLPLPRFG